MGNKKAADRSERYALHAFGQDVIVPCAGDAAMAAFRGCGKAEGWRHWIAPSGQLVKTSLVLMAKFLDDHPDAPAEAIYIHLMSFPGGENAPGKNMWDGRMVAWKDAPMSVRAGYETFRHVYQLLWRMLRTHDAKMARALPPRSRPRLVNSDMMETTMRADNAGRMGGRERLRRNVVPIGHAQNPRNETPGAHGHVGQEPDGCPASDTDQGPNEAA